MTPKRKKIIIVVVILIAIVVVWLVIKGKKPKEQYSTADVVSGSLIQTVNETGTVKPIQELSLGFMSSGKISSIDVKVGDEVVAGASLISLDKEALELKKKEAEAGLMIANATLSKIRAGASYETVAVSRSQMDQALASEVSASTDLEKVKQTTAENVLQAEKTLADLESSDSSTQTSQEQAVYSAQTALDNAKKSGQKSIDNSRDSLLLILSDKILAGKIALDNLNTILEDDNAKNVLGVKNSSLLPSTKESRLNALDLIAGAEADVATAKKTQSTFDIDKAGQSVGTFLLKTGQSLNYAYALLEATITSSSFSQTKLDSYKTLVSSQNTQISAAASTVENYLQAFNNAQLSYGTTVATAEETLRQAKVNLDSAITTARNNLRNIRLAADQQISSAKSRLDSAKKSVDLARAQLNNISAPARSQDVTLAEAQVSQANSSLENIEKQITDSVLTAPLNGVITQIAYEVGEQFSPAQPAIKMLADGDFEIEVDISESDINKIKVGDETEITLDAFSSDTSFPGMVSFIEPAQTLIQDVVYYKVKVAFSDLDKIKTDLATRGLSFKSGMTADIVITTDKRDNVLQVPARAIIEKDGNKIVRLDTAAGVKEVIVETGLRGNDGLTEITSGLTAGEKVITFINTTP